MCTIVTPADLIRVGLQPILRIDFIIKILHTNIYFQGVQRNVLMRPLLVQRQGRMSCTIIIPFL